jgi:hypothetical protein
MGLKEGTSITAALEYICSDAFKAQFLAAIALNQTLLNGFCNLVQACGTVPGTSTPIIGPISWSIP